MTDANDGKHCAKCGSLLHGVTFKIKNTPVCAKCYNEFITSKKEQEAQKKSLLVTLASLFSIPECPPSASAVIDSLDGKGFSALIIQATVQYYSRVLGKRLKDVDDIAWIVPKYAEDMGNYCKEMERAKEQALATSAPPPTIIIEVNAPKQKQVRRYDYDLNKPL